MARSNYMVDRALILRSEVGETFGMEYRADDAEIGDWIPCRLRVPTHDTEEDAARYSSIPSHELHLLAYDLSGVRIKLQQSDLFRVYQRINDYWVAYPAPFRIVGAIQPKRRRTRLISYIVPVIAPEKHY